jgi:hypothetical protein
MAFGTLGDYQEFCQAKRAHGHQSDIEPVAHVIAAKCESIETADEIRTD